MLLTTPRLLASVVTLLILGGCAVAPAGPAGCPDCRGYALADIVEERTENPALPRLPVYAGRNEPSLYVNAGYETIYRLAVWAAAGDILRVRAQVEMSNPNLGHPVRGHLRVSANGALIGTEHAQDNVAEGAHHMPMWTDGFYRVPADGETVFEARYAATAEDPPDGLSVVINTGYGHLVAEHYRPYRPAPASGGRLLAGYTADLTRNATAFFGHGDCNGSLDMRTTAYQVSVSRRAGDLVRLLGQATTSWAGNTRDERAGMAAWDDGRVDPTKQMHGQGIFVSETERKLSPWATENVHWAGPDLPLWSDAVDRADAEGDTLYSLTVHGCYARFARIQSGAGHLYAMRFSRPDADGTLALADSVTARLYGDATIRTNSGWQTVTELERPVERGDILRVTGYVELQYPEGAEGGISCRSEIRPDAALDASSAAMKYLTQRVRRLPLRNEVVTAALASGTRTLRLQVLCEDDGRAGPLTVIGDRTQLLLDHYRPVR